MKGRASALPLLVLTVSACNSPGSSSGGGPSPSDAASGTADAGRAATTRPSPGPSGSAHGSVQPHTPAACRAAGVEGRVTSSPLWGAVAPSSDAGPGSGMGGADGGVTNVLASFAVPDNVWIDVGKASRLTTRDATSTRETNYVGPGRFHVCIDHKEEAWVEAGVFESVGGAGERPGGEEWVSTPLGTARYDAAKLKITVKDKTVEVRVASGNGYFWPADGVTSQFFSDAGTAPSMNDQGWVRLDGLTSGNFTVPRSVLSAEGAAAALDRCTRAAGEAKSLAASLSEADASIADLGPKHVVARRQAHAACDVATLRIASLSPSPAREALAVRVRAAEGDWKSIGPPGPSSAVPSPAPDAPEPREP